MMDHSGTGKKLSQELLDLMAQAKGPEQESLVKRFQEQREGTAKREFPQGRLGGDDDGSVTFVVSSDREKQVVRLDYAVPVKWVGMSPRQAIELAQLLIQHAREISKEPIPVVLF